MSHLGKTFYYIDRHTPLTIGKTEVVRETEKLVFFSTWNPCAAYTQQAEKWKFEEKEAILHTTPITLLEAYIKQREEEIAKHIKYQSEAQSLLLKLKAQEQPKA